MDRKNMLEGEEGQSNTRRAGMTEEILPALSGKTAVTGSLYW
jgi:hypothetical protein